MKIQIACAVIAGAIGARAEATAYNFLKPQFAPMVESCTYASNVCVRMSENFPFRLRVPAAEQPAAQEWVGRHVKAWFNTTPALSVAEPPLGLSTNCEAYVLTATPSNITIDASSLAGVRNACFTLRQAAMPDRGGYTLGKWILPELKVVDEPKLAFRAMHFCWFPELRPREMERYVRMAAYYKFNHVIIEAWGGIRSERHPWFGRADGGGTKEAIADVKKVAEDLGVTLIPQINITGHATFSRDNSGKHAVLDASPEHFPLFEPERGWNWCLSNPEARRTIIELVEELHDAFGRPPYFHLGCDEFEVPICPTCRAVPFPQLLADHMLAVIRVLEKRGVTPMIWQDRMIGGRTGWEGFNCWAVGNSDQVLDRLPRSVVICDWYYGNARSDYPTMRYFKEKGFPVCACSWENRGGCESMAQFAIQNGLKGLIATTWHKLYGFDLSTLFIVPAGAAWGTGYYNNHALFKYHWRQIGWDMKLADPNRGGLDYHQIPTEPFTRP